MTEDTMQSTQTEAKPYPIGPRLKSARESLGMDTRDVAAQLRLHENVITMLEQEEIPNNLPTIFIRGYIRAYGKFLDLPDYEIKQALAPIEPPATVIPQTEPSKSATPKIKKSVMMRAVNIAIAATLFSLVWQWWHTHSTGSIMIGDKNLAIPFDSDATADAHEAATTLSMQSPVNTGNPTTAEAIKIPLAPQVTHALANNTLPVSNEKASAAIVVPPMASSAVTTMPADATAPSQAATSQPAATTPQNKPVVAANTTRSDEYDDEDDYDDVE